jgi:GT2 family glycosyltransferase
MKSKTPFFSVVIPTYNRPEQLWSCLDAFSLLDYPRSCFEIIVVDDGGTVRLDPTIDAFHDRLNVMLLTQPHSGPAAARNAGAARAKGPFIAFTDDDCEPDSTWLNGLATGFGDSEDKIIGGQTLNGLSNNPYSTVTQMIVDYLVESSGVSPNQKRFFPSNNLAVPAKIFRVVGGFSTNFRLGAGEDREFCSRLLYHNYPLVYAPEAIVYHLHNLTLSTFLRRHFDYGRGSFLFHQTRARSRRQRIRLESMSFYMNLMLYPLSRTPRFRTIPIGTLLAFSQVANAAGYWWEARHRDRK